MITEDQLFNLVGIVLIAISIIFITSSVKTYREEKRLAQSQVAELKKIKRKLNA